MASCPGEVRAPVQYGPTVKGIALYLLYGQFLPYARVAELLTDLCGCPLSLGTLEAFVREGADRLVKTEEQIKQASREAEVLGNDETGVRVQATLHWLHVARTDQFTHYAISQKRGQAATDATLIFPQFHGTTIRDGATFYRKYTSCQHALCNAHHLRKLRFFHEHEHQSWASNIQEHLLVCHTTVEKARARGETGLSADVLEPLTTTYHQLIEAGRPNLLFHSPHSTSREESNKRKPRICWIGFGVMPNLSCSS